MQSVKLRRWGLGTLLGFSEQSARKRFPHLPPLLSQPWPDLEHLKTSLSNVSTRVRWERGMFLKLIYQEKETLWFLTDTHLILKLLRSFTNLSGSNYCELFIPGHPYVRSLLWGERVLSARCVFSSTAVHSHRYYQATCLQPTKKYWLTKIKEDIKRSGYELLKSRLSFQIPKEVSFLFDCENLESFVCSWN